jgi:hypothetical protein
MITIKNGRRLSVEEINAVLFKEPLTKERLVEYIFMHDEAKKLELHKEHDREAKVRNAATLVQIIDDTFGGQMQERIYRYLYLNNDLIKSGDVTVITDIKKNTNIAIGKFNFKFVAGTSDFTASQSPAKIIERPLEPIEYSLQEIYDFKTFSDTFFALLQGYGVWASYEAPEIVKAFLTLEMLEFITSTNASLIMRGSAKTPNVPDTFVFNGFEQLLETGDVTNSDVAKKISTTSIAFTAAAAVSGDTTLTRLTVSSSANFAVGDYVTLRRIAGGVGTNLNGAIYNTGNLRASLNGKDVRFSEDYIQIKAIANATSIDINIPFANANTFNGTTATGSIFYINASNVVQTLKQAWQSLPEQVRRMPGCKIWISQHIFDNFSDTEAGRLGNSYQKDNQGMEYFLGIPFKIVDYISPNTMIGCVGSDNLFIGMPATSDTGQINVIDLKTTENKLQYSYRADFGLCVQVAKYKEVVFVRPL